MNWLRRIAFSLRKFLAPARSDDELDDELRFHLEMSVAKRMKEGMSEAEARRTAHREFGNLAVTQEDCRESWGMAFLAELVRDLRYGFRMMVRYRVSSAFSILSLAMGIGLAASIYVFVKAALLQGLPFHDPDQITVLLRGNATRNIYVQFSIHDYMDYRERQSSFEGIASYQRPSDMGDMAVNFSAASGKGRIYRMFVSDNFFQLLGTPPALGPGFDMDGKKLDDDHVVVISHRLWRDHFSGDPDVIGQRVLVDDETFVVVGVMSGDFAFPGAEVDIWQPLPAYFMEYSRKPPEYDLTGANGPDLVVFGRLKKEFSIRQAEEELSAIAQSLGKIYPESNSMFDSVRVIPYVRAILGPYHVQLIWVMQAFALLVLFMICANISNLLLARLSLREKELSIRRALGASSRRIVFQVLTESLCLTLLGGVLGMLLAAFGTKLIWTYLTAEGWPSWLMARLDLSFYAFVVALVGFTAFFSGMVTAWRATRLNINSRLKDDTRTSTGYHLGRFARFLVVAQLAVSCVLLVGAGLMVETVLNLTRMHLPYDPSEYLVVRYDLPYVSYPKRADQYAFSSEVETRLLRTPGVKAAAAISRLNYTRRFYIEIDGVSYPADQDKPTAFMSIVSGNYFGLFDQPLLEGRTFSETDTLDSTLVAVVNTNFAQKHWPGQSPLGKRVRIPDRDDRWFTIIGVAPDLQMEGPYITQSDGVGLYRSLSQRPDNNITLLVRPEGNPASLANTIRAIFRDIDPELPVWGFTTLDKRIGSENESVKAIGGLFVFFGFMAVVFSAAGLYGLISFAVNQRFREYGVRMAFGATGRDIVLSVFRRAGLELSLGLVLGILLALGLTRFMRGILHEVDPADPVVFVTVIFILLLTVFCSILGPACRAARIDPMTALRYE